VLVKGTQSWPKTQGGSQDEGDAGEEEDSKQDISCPPRQRQVEGVRLHRLGCVDMEIVDSAVNHKVKVVCVGAISGACRGLVVRRCGYQIFWRGCQIRGPKAQPGYISTAVQHGHESSCTFQLASQTALEF
jgi:hypothetical protein